MGGLEFMQRIDSRYRRSSWTKWSKTRFEYDLMQATTEQIASKLALTGAELGGGWMGALKLAFINYLEEREVDSLELTNRKRCH